MDTGDPVNPSGNIQGKILGKYASSTGNRRQLTPVKCQQAMKGFNKYSKTRHNEASHSEDNIKFLCLTF